MKPHTLMLLFLLTLVPLIEAQSAVELAAKFPHHEVYEIVAANHTVSSLVVYTTFGIRVIMTPTGSW
jgi:hypothetical protein